MYYKPLKSTRCWSCSLPWCCNICIQKSNCHFDSKLLFPHNFPVVKLSGFQLNPRSCVAAVWPLASTQCVSAHQSCCLHKRKHLLAPVKKRISFQYLFRGQFKLLCKVVKHFHGRHGGGWKHVLVRCVGRVDRGAICAAPLERDT
jgi:hypothetical protein